MHAYKHLQTEEILRNQACVRGLKWLSNFIHLSTQALVEKNQLKCININIKTA